MRLILEKCSPYDLWAQRSALEPLGILDDRVYTGKGYTNHNRHRLRLHEALVDKLEAKCRD